MASFRLCMVAGLTAITAVMSADLAIAQDCPEWLKWACPGGASSNAAGREGVRQDQQPSRTQTTSRSAMGGGPKQTRPAAADTTTNPKPQQAKTSEQAGSATAARNARNGDQRGDRRLAQHGDGQGGRTEHVMNDQEKELFRQFLEWEKGQRLNAGVKQ
jgi:hypothetical protein